MIIIATLSPKAELACICTQMEASHYSLVDSKNFHLGKKKSLVLNFSVMMAQLLAKNCISTFAAKISIAPTKTHVKNSILSFFRCPILDPPARTNSCCVKGNIYQT